jgi:hypothetical protein
MKINTILSIVAGLFITVQVVVAQTTPTPPANNGNMNRREKLADTTPEQRASQQTARMKKQLALTTEQEPTVAAINLKYAQQMQTLIETGGRNRQTMKQARDMAASKDAELKTVFTADQYKQYDTFRDEQKDRLKEMRGKRNNR